MTVQTDWITWLGVISQIFPLLYFIGGFLLMFALGPAMIARLKALKGTKWAPREDTPDSHAAKAGTPSMGGIGIIGSATFVYLALLVNTVILGIYLSGANDLYPVSYVAGALLFPVVVVLHAFLGFADDNSKARGNGGLLARQKLAGQVILAVSFLAGALLMGFQLTKNLTPFWQTAAIFVLCCLVIIGTSNAVNLTDGIDGLAAGLAVQVGLAMGFVQFFWLYWMLYKISNPTSSIGLAEAGTVGVGDPDTFSSSTPSPDVALFWLALAGACLGFLAYNKNPARVFMGDTGSLALGAALGAGAILTKTVFLLPFIGFIFFVEMFSVIFQVAYFKYTKKKFGEGKRLFRRAPLHHHYELGGWREWKVVVVFWGINALTTILGLFLWSRGIIPAFPN